MAEPAPRILGTDLPEGTRFVGSGEAAGAGAAREPGWRPGRAAPAPADVDLCVACGLCLPHCPTYLLTGQESASPRGRIAAMRAVGEGLADPGPTFAGFMDACLACRACEDVCPSHVPFGRMMEAAREQIEPTRSARSRFVRWVGFHWVLPHPSLLRASAVAMTVVRPLLPRRVRDLVPRRGAPFATLPRVTEPPHGIEARGTVALLAGCAQDRWFHATNEATVRVLAGNGWRVLVPRQQACCGALPAHNGRLAIARRLARRAAHAFEGADAVIANAAGCSAHMAAYEDLEPGTRLPVSDLMTFLHTEGLTAPLGTVERTVAYHDACHASRAQGIRAEPRALLAQIPGLQLVEIPGGERCCGAAGIYNVTQPDAAGELGRQRAEAILATGADVVASANPGCSMQLAAALRAQGAAVEVVHPVDLLDRAMRAATVLRASASSGTPARS